MSKWFWLDLPAELWVMIMDQLELQDAAVFSLTCKRAIDIFICALHWKRRLARLGRTITSDQDHRAAFRAAIYSSFVLWMDTDATKAFIRESHLGSPEGIGLFPILQMGPLGHTHPHDNILGCIHAMAHLQLCRLTQPHEFYMTDQVTPKQLMRAMLVVANQFDIRVTKMHLLTSTLGGIQFRAWDSININSETWLEFMGVERDTCQEIDRMLGWLVGIKAKKI